MWQCKKTLTQSMRGKFMCSVRERKGLEIRANGMRYVLENCEVYREKALILIMWALCTSLPQLLRLNPPTPPNMSHLTSRSFSAISCGGITPESLLWRNNLVHTAGPPLSSPPPQQVTESRERESRWRGCGGSINQIPRMFPPQYWRVFEIAGMPADCSWSSVERGAQREVEKLDVSSPKRGVWSCLFSFPLYWQSWC